MTARARSHKMTGTHYVVVRRQTSSWGLWQENRLFKLQLSSQVKKKLRTTKVGAFEACEETRWLSLG